MPLRRTVRAAVALVTVGLLAACSSGGSDDSGADGSASPSPSSAAVAVPGADATVTVPPTWSHSVQGTDAGSQLVVQAPTATGSPRFMANVVVTAKKAKRTLEEESTAALTAAEAMPGWTGAATGGGPTQVGNLPAVVVVGTYDASGIDVLQTETIVELTEGETRKFVYLTTSVAPAAKNATEAEKKAQADATAQTEAVVASLAPRS